MEVEIVCTSEKYGLDHDDVMSCDSPFDVCEAFIDKADGSIYFPADDIGNGPFWLKLDRGGGMTAYHPSNLPLMGELLEVHPKVKVEY